MKKQYPTKVFHEIIRDALDDWCEYNEIDKSIAYTQFLTLLGQFFSDSVIHANRHETHPNIYSVGVANRGSGKSHVIKLYKKVRKDFEQFTLSQSISGGDDIKLKINVGDTTPEKLLDTISNNQNAGIDNRIMVYRDEGSALFGSFGKYEKGNNLSQPTTDQLVYMSGFTGEIESSERVGGSRIINNPSYLSIMTTIQPKFLQTFFSNKDDGFTDRFIFAFNDVEKEVFYRECDQGDEEEFNNKVEKMNNFIISLYRKNAKRKYRLYFEDKTEREAHIVMVRGMMNSLKREFGEKASKMILYYYKFLTLIAIMRDSDDITMDIVNDAMDLMEYYIESTRRLEVYADEGVGFLHDKVIDTLKKHGSNTLSTIINRCTPLQTHIKWKYADTKTKKDNAKQTVSDLLNDMVNRGLLEFDGDKYSIMEN